MPLGVILTNAKSCQLKKCQKQSFNFSAPKNVVGLFQDGFVTAFNSLIATFQSDLQNLLKTASDLEKLVSLDQVEIL